MTKTNTRRKPAPEEKPPPRWITNSTMWKLVLRDEGGRQFYTLSNNPKDWPDDDWDDAVPF